MVQVIPLQIKCIAEDTSQFFRCPICVCVRVCARTCARTRMIHMPVTFYTLEMRSSPAPVQLLYSLQKSIIWSSSCLLTMQLNDFLYKARSPTTKGEVKCISWGGSQWALTQLIHGHWESKTDMKNSILQTNWDCSEQFLLEKQHVGSHNRKWSLGWGKDEERGKKHKLHSQYLHIFGLLISNIHVCILHNFKKKGNLTKTSTSQTFVIEKSSPKVMRKLYWLHNVTITK